MEPPLPELPEWVVVELECIWNIQRENLENHNFIFLPNYKSIQMDREKLQLNRTLVISKGPKF